MKILLITVAATLAAGMVDDAKSADHSQGLKRHAKRYGETPARGTRRSYPDASGWYPHDSNELPFGSSLWWEQMDREGRLRRGG